MDRTTASLRRAILGLAALTLGTLSGCASLSESQCVASDWHTVGYSDGASGQDSSRLLKHQDACVKHGVTPDREAYMVGWNEGVVRYCTPENGFQQGQRGAQYHNVCPGDLEPDFHQAYLSGRELYLAQSEVSQLERSIASKTRQLDKVEHDLRETEAQLVSSDREADRLRRLEDTKALAKTQGELESEITALRVQAAVKKDRLEALRQSLAMSN